MNFFVNADGGLTTPGYVLVAVVLFALLIVMSAVGSRGRKKAGAKILVFSAAAIALAFAMSFITIIHMPMGGSVTPFSMLFVVLVGYWYGPAVGLMAGVSYGLLQLIQDPYILSLPQMLCDYIFAFGALGLSGFFSNKKHGLLKGYIAAVCGRFVFAVLSGILFFADYTPENMTPFTYSAAYNGAYLGLEAAFTIVILLIPAVNKALDHVKTMALS